MHHILVIGVGSIGERHTRCFLHTQRAQVSICEVNDTLAEQVASRYPLLARYRSIAEALEQSRRNQPIDAAVICTPAPLHIVMAMELVRQNVAVLIEKPLSTSIEGVADLQAEIARRKVPAMVAYVWRCHPAAAAMHRAVVVEQRFGRPLQLVAVSGQHFPTFRPAYRDIYYKDHRTGGGAIQDAMTHQLNLGEWLAGPIRRLTCDAGHLALEGVSVEDTVHLIARQGEGVLASYSLSQFQPANEFTVTINCQRGVARLEAHESRWRWMIKPNDPWRDETVGPVDRDTSFIAQAHAFLDVLEGKRQPTCSLAEGVQTLKVNMAALGSWREGRNVEIAG